MKIRYLIIYIFIFILVGVFVCYKIAIGDGSAELMAETTEINRLIVSVEENWNEISNKKNEQVAKTGAVDYVVIDAESEVLEYTRDDMSKTISAATTHYDIIRDIEVEGRIVGRLIVHNPSSEQQQA
ncbi:MAG: sensor histidine kinase, partial [Eubacterium sp.]|nr:sensor histidine kinase [Eubacterium sp.]